METLPNRQDSQPPTGEEQSESQQTQPSTQTKSDVSQPKIVHNVGGMSLGQFIRWREQQGMGAGRVVSIKFPGQEKIYFNEDGSRKK